MGSVYDVGGARRALARFPRCDAENRSTPVAAGEGKGGPAMKSFQTRTALVLMIGTCIALAGPTIARAQDADDYFRQNCSMCHTIGQGPLIGPDLKDLAKRRDRAWLVRFLMNPKAVLDSGDPYGAKLLQDANGLVMPAEPTMTPALANSLLDYIEGGPGAEQAPTPGTAISDRPFAAGDVESGKEIFLGERALHSGGPACLSCHTLGTIGSLGGGRLGPDLTEAIDRLGGRKGLGAWLSKPPTPTMQSLYGGHPLQPDEILPLLALMEDARDRSHPADNSSIWKFFATGLGGMLLGLAAIHLVWRGRLRSVRGALVRAQGRGGQ